MPNKYLSQDQALAKIQRYCVFQDRCHAEVRSKLIEWGVYGDTLEEILSTLISDNFLNEERFARSFARGKFRIKQWGRIRIVSELKSRRISEYCIRKALTEINEAEYQDTLLLLLQKKSAELQTLPPAEQKQKLLRFAQQRGFETNRIFDVFHTLFSHP
jgi:regulatory protein